MKLSVLFVDYIKFGEETYKPADIDMLSAFVNLFGKHHSANETGCIFFPFFPGVNSFLKPDFTANTEHVPNQKMMFAWGVMLHTNEH